MTVNLQEEIKQTKPFGSLQEELWLNLSRTTAQVGHVIEQRLRSYGLSPTQYNVLRILRGAGPSGLSCGEVAERMLTRDPDITRLLDRLERRGLVVRARASADRRVITVRITPEGLRILAKLDKPVAECHRRQLGHLGQRPLKRLIELLNSTRVTSR